MRVSILLALLLASMTLAGQPTPLALAQTIELPNVEGRIDHLAFDAMRQRLFVAALGNNTVEAIDLGTSGRVRSLSGFDEPQGLALSSDGSRLAVANAQGGAVDILNAENLTRAMSISLSDDADNVRYEAAAKRFWVGYGTGALAAIDGADGRRAGEVRLAGHPESFQLERSGPRIFVNVPTAHHIVVVDRVALKVTATWPVVTASSNFPMALDEANHRLFIGCRSPAAMLVYDTSSGKQIASVVIAGDTDDLFYDVARKRVYVSAGEGFLDVLQQQDADHYTRVAHIPTAGGARTSLFVPETSRLYLAVPHRGSQKAEIRVYAVRD
jgi:DNA-binding beta-propeller fold protein YncE